MTITNTSTAKKVDYSVIIDNKTVKCSTNKTCFGTHIDSAPNCISCAKKSKLVYKCCSQATIDARIAENAEKAELKKAELAKSDQEILDLEEELKKEGINMEKHMQEKNAIEIAKKAELEKSDIELTKISDCRALVNSLRVVPELSKDEQTELERERVKQDLLYLELSSIIDQETEKISDLSKIDSKIVEIKKMESSAILLENEDMLKIIKTTLIGSVELQTSEFLMLEKIKKSKMEKITEIQLKIVPNIPDLQRRIAELEKMLLSSTSGKVKKSVKAGTGTSTRKNTNAAKTSVVNDRYDFCIPLLYADGMSIDGVLFEFLQEFDIPERSANKFIVECNGSLRHKLSKGKEGTFQTRYFNFLNGKTSELEGENCKSVQGLCDKFNASWERLVESGIITDIEKS